MSRIRANQFTDKAGTGAPTFPNGVQVTGVVTATSFSGALTGNVTGNINSSGISTLGNTVVGGGTTQLVVTGNARITGILTIGTSSITLDGSSNQVNVGTGVTLHHTNGVQVGDNNLHSTVLTVNQINASGVSTFSSGIVVAAGSTAAPSISPAGDSNTGIFFPSADTIAFGEGGAEALRIDSSGRIGIGVTNPQKELQINATTPTIRLEENSAGAKRLELSVNSSAEAKVFAEQSASQLLFGTVGTERARIDSSGRLLVGTSTGSGNIMLHVVKSGTVNTRVESSSFANTNVCSHSAFAGNRLAEIGVYKHSGITNAGAFIRLDEEDGTNSFLWVDNSGNVRIGTSVDFVGTTSGTVVGTQTSDERIKNILGPVEYGLDTIKQIEPVRYTFKSEPDAEKLGFIAQQVQPLIPQSVFDTNEHIEGEPEDAPTKLGIEYVSLIPVLVNAIKELSAEVDALKAQLS